MYFLLGLLDVIQEVSQDDLGYSYLLKDNSGYFSKPTLIMKWWIPVANQLILKFGNYLWLLRRTKEAKIKCIKVWQTIVLN